MRLGLIATIAACAVVTLSGCFLAHSRGDSGDEPAPTERTDAGPERVDAGPAPEPDAGPPPRGHDICPSEPPEGRCPCGVEERFPHPDPRDGTCFACSACEDRCEVPHADDGPLLSGSGAHLSWQAPGGFAGHGPAITVTEDGTGGGALRVWDTITGFEPATTPAEPPDATVELSFVELDQLFLRLRAADTAELPHDGPAADCYPVVYASEHDSGDPVLHLEYNTAAQIRPELGCVTEWIASHLPEDARNPAAHCDF